ncbi:MAG TPA: hypothetical protein IAB63_09040 [Candidatus Onthocola gallistercoris]|uniref:Uncharacterized protein n=1 Tax=Candidatus Onthocola gallistercoris TaxID=2840876 RepID=A0A9D1HI54_9FIRM|nr:hypothetical protein [Candidatus Onthocola gallistercoris]
MSTEHILIHEILSEHRDRMENLKKYYPFFKLQELSLNAFKDGRYESVDMGYVTMAVLRFFIEENNFKDMDVTYESYEKFMTELLQRDFDLPKSPDDKEFIQYLFDKICNEGRPFYYTYYDPEKKEKHRGRVRLIESHYQDGGIGYRITSEAVEFYLDTKETKDESKISIQQLLLEKMIRSRNYQGGVDVIRRINGEVRRLMSRKDEIVALLGRNIFEGVEALEEFSQTGLKWFDEEQRLFDSNLELVRKALKTTGGEETPVPEEIYLLNQELKNSMEQHRQLLAACTRLQVQADDMLAAAKRSRFRQAMDFRDLLGRSIRKDDIRTLEAMVAPLFSLNIKKTFSMERLDEMLQYPLEDNEKKESVSPGVLQDYEYEDEKEEQRIQYNMELLVKAFFDILSGRRKLTLKELHHLLVMRFTDNIERNGDYFAFLTHLSQKDEYDLDMVKDHPDTFLEDRMAAVLRKDKKKDYEGMRILLHFLPEEKIHLGEHTYMTNIEFERRGM